MGGAPSTYFFTGMRIYGDGSLPNEYSLLHQGNRLEIGDTPFTSEFFMRESSLNTHDVHTSCHSGLDPGRSILEHKTFGRLSPETRRSCKIAVGMRFAELNFIGCDEHCRERKTDALQSNLREPSPCGSDHCPTLGRQHIHKIKCARHRDNSILAFFLRVNKKSYFLRGLKVGGDKSNRLMVLPAMSHPQ